MTILYWLNFIILWYDFFKVHCCNYIRIPVFPNFLCIISQVETNFSLILTNKIILWTISSQMQFQSIIILVLPNFFFLRYISLYINFTVISFPSNITSNNIFPKFLSIVYKKKKKNVENFSSFNKLHAYPNNLI